MKHLTAEPDLSCVDEPYRSVIRKALFKDPAKRYGNVSEMLAGFDTSPIVTATATLVPPVVAQPVSPSDETLYIGDEDQTDEMVFGPVRGVVSAEPVARAAETRPRVQVAETNPAAPPEPIAKAVRVSWGKGLSWWRNAKLSTPVKVVLLLIAVFMLILNHQWLVPLGITLGAVYLVYLGGRALVLALSDPKRDSPTPPAATNRAADAAPRPPAATRLRERRCHAQRASRRKWREEARNTLRAKSYGERVAELSGSFLMSAIVATVLCLLMLLVAGKPLDDSVYTWTFFAWLTLTSVAGAWIVLTVAKCWETCDGEQFQRRFIMLIAGLLFGLAAFGFAEFLDVRPTDDLIVRSLPVSTNMVEPGGALKLPAFLVYFGLLFVVLRWWTQADPLRTSRLSLWATGGCVLWAWVWHMIWPFPQPWGFMLAATVSVAVQLSAPWMSPMERKRIRQHLNEA